MEIEDTGQEEMELGFTPVPAGTYIYQLMDGVELVVSESSESKGYRIPLQVDSIVEGDAGAEGMPASWYINVIKKDGEANPFGEKQINSILTLTGLVDSFAKNFKGAVDIDDEKLVNALILKLPGKFLRMTHDIQVSEDDEGNKKYRMNFTKVAKIKKKKSSKPPAEDKQEDKKEEKSDDSGEDSWVD